MGFANNGGRMVYPITTQSVAAAATTQGVIDGRDFEQLILRVQTSTTDNATNTPAVFRLQESDSTQATTFVDITSAVGGGPGGFVIPSGVTDPTAAPYVVEFAVDLRRRRRFLRVQISPRVTQLITATGELMRPAETRESLANRNLRGVVNL